MKLIDLTYPISHNMKEYPGDPKTKIKRIASDDCTLFEFTTGLHTGTHVDAPYHYLKNADKISDLNLEDFMGKAKVMESSGESINSTEPLEEIVIIKTGWSKHWGSARYFNDYPYLSIEFAERLIDENVKGVAIDTCSVDKHDADEIHKKLLKNDIWIVENLANSDKLKGKCYKSYFIPLKIEAEASPIRAFVEEI